MVMQTQSEMKTLLYSQYNHACLKSIAPLILGIGLTITIPLFFNKNTNRDKLINGYGFIINVIAFSSSYLTSGEITKLRGKLTMFETLEKERFIQEQILSQNFLLQQSKQYYEMPIIEPTIEPVMPSQDVDVIGVDNHNAITTSNSKIVEITICPHCDSNNISKNGSSNGKQRYVCKDCNKTFSEE